MTPQEIVGWFRGVIKSFELGTKRMCIVCENVLGNGEGCDYCEAKRYEDMYALV
tara:strand:- start:53 stop:214 length:162 start_codon:yes stop_codon:yes gene_type:complete